MIGPFIPEHLLKSKGDDSREDQAQETVDPTAADEEDDIAAYAPELPPDMLEPKAAQPQPESTSSRRRRAPIGPSLPTGPSHDDEDDDVIGPVLPAGIIEVGSASCCSFQPYVINHLCRQHCTARRRYQFNDQ